MESKNQVIMLDYFPTNGRKIELPEQNCQDLSALCEFALSFNGYKFTLGGPCELSSLWDSVFERFDAIQADYISAESLEKVSIEELRCCLFFQQRGDRWNQDYGSTEDYNIWVNLIRRKMEKSK